MGPLEVAYKDHTKTMQEKFQCQILAELWNIYGWDLIYKVIDTNKTEFFFTMDCFHILLSILEFLYTYLQEKFYLPA